MRLIFSNQIHSYSYSVFIFDSNIFVFAFGFYFRVEYIRIRIRFLFLKQIYSYSYSVVKILFGYLWIRPTNGSTQTLTPHPPLPLRCGGNRGIQSKPSGGVQHCYVFGHQRDPLHQFHSIRGITQHAHALPRRPI